MLTCLQSRIRGPAPDLLAQHLHPDETPRRCVHTGMFQRRRLGPVFLIRPYASFRVTSLLRAPSSGSLPWPITQSQPRLHRGPIKSLSGVGLTRKCFFVIVVVFRSHVKTLFSCRSAEVFFKAPPGDSTALCLRVTGLFQWCPKCAP